MIGTRGPDRIEVLEPKGIPVKEIAESIILRNYLTGLGRRYNISKEEILECVHHFLDTNQFTEKDHIDFVCDLDKIGELNISTIAVSDLVFISSVVFGTLYLPDEDSINDLYIRGIAELIRECLTDVSQDSELYKDSDLHRIVYEGFTTAYGEIDSVEADQLLLKMESTDDNT